MVRGLVLFAIGAVAVVAGIFAFQFFSAQANGNNNNVGTANNQDARNAFLSDRGGTGVVTDTVAGGNAGFGGPGGFAGGFPGGGGVFGTVDSVSGDTIKVTNPVSNTVVSVHVGSDAKLYKEAELQPSDIKVGDEIVATGSKSGDAFTAMNIQVGATDGFGFGGFGGGRGNFGAGASGTPGAGFGGGGRGNFGGANGTPGPRANRTPGAGFGGGNGGQGGAFTGPDGTPMEFVRGSVSTVNGSSVVVKAQDGSSSTVLIGTDTRISGRQEAALTDVKQGDTIIATGSQSGDTFEATTIQIGALQQMVRP